MANENKANYSKIGFILIVALVATIGTLVYLGGAGNNKEELLAETYCDTAVSGLSKGSEVNFRGVKVGEVKDITFVWREYPEASDEDARQVLIELSLDARMLFTRRDSSPEEAMRRFVEHGLRATVVSSGITGLSHIELNYPKIPAPPRRISWHPNGVCMPPAPSILESFSDAATRLVNQLNDVDVRGTWSNITSLAYYTSRLADNANSILESQKAAIGGIMDEIEKAGNSIRLMADEIRDNPSLLIRPRDAEPLPETMK